MHIDHPSELVPRLEAIIAKRRIHSIVRLPTALVRPRGALPIRMRRRTRVRRRAALLKRLSVRRHMRYESDQALGSARENQLGRTRLVHNPALKRAVQSLATTITLDTVCHKGLFIQHQKRERTQE